MYNENLKNEYLNKNASRNVALKYNVIPLFNKCQPYEEMHEKDLCNFSTVEIIDMYKGFYTTSIEYLMSITSQLKYYTYFCLENGIVNDSQNHYEEISTDIISNCINKYAADNKIVTREKLLEDIEILPNASDKFLLLALFEGFGNKLFDDIVGLTKEDLDTEDGCIHLKSGRSIKPSKKLLELGYESVDEYDYYPFNSDSNKKFLYAEDDPHIIKRLYNADYSDNPVVNRKRIYNKLIRIKEYLGEPYATYTALNESGRIDYIINSEDLKDTIIESALQDKEVVKRYGNVSSINIYLLKFAEFYNRS